MTPEKAVLDQIAEMVVLPMFDGELGVLPGTAPIIGRLGAGELRLKSNRQRRDALLRRSRVRASPRQHDLGADREGPEGGRR